jgi:hypothetical protein
MGPKASPAAYWGQSLVVVEGLTDLEVGQPHALIARDPVEKADEPVLVGAQRMANLVLDPELVVLVAHRLPLFGVEF